MRNKEQLLELEKATNLLEEALNNFPYEFDYTGYENVSENEEIIGKEIIFTICKGDIEIKIGGWVELDRRFQEPHIWFSGIIIIDLPNEKIKMGAGYNDTYMVLRMDYDIKNKKWSKLYKDSI